MATLQEPHVKPQWRRVVKPPTRPARGFNVSAWAIEHPYIVIAFYVAVVVLALVAVFGGVMPRRMMPYVESPLVGVVTMQPGLPAQEMETYISKPIEERMTDIRGVRYIRSTSQDGLSVVSLEFPYGANIQRATTDVQSVMNSAQADLPQTGANLKPSWVLPIDPLNIPILSLSLTGDLDKGWTPVALRQFAENQTVAALKQVADVQSVEVYGGAKRQLRVVVDRDKLAAYDYSILDVRDTIDRNSVARPAGILTSGPNESIVRVADLAQDAQAVASYPLGAKNGQTVYLKDVATVTDGVREQRSGYQAVFNDGVGHSDIEGLDNTAVEVSVIQNPSAGSPPVVANVMDQVRRLEADHPGLHFRVAYDNAHFVNILFHNTGEELLAAVLLCGLVVFLFLNNARGTLISMTTIPVSMAMAILLMVPFGFSLNSSTLIGLLISIGRLVDDSVIDIHAVERHLKMGKDPKTATVDGITEVRLAVAASTLMLVLALTPLLFCGGITQLMFVGLVYPIIFGLLASFLVSLTLTAVMSSRLLRAHETSPRRRGLAHVMAPVQSTLDRLDGGYRRLVLVLLRNKFSVIGAAVCTVVIGFGFYSFLGSEMMPLADVGQGYGVLEMAPGASYARTEAAAASFEHILLQYPEVKKVSTEIGSEPGGTYFTGYAMNQVNTATLMITLSDKDERGRTIWQIIDAARAQALRTIPNIRRLQIKEMGSDVMASSEAPVQILVTGPDLHILSQLAGQVADIARKTPGASQVSTSWATEKPSYTLNVNATRAAELGITPADVADQAYYAMGGGLTSEFYRLPNVRQDTIDVRYKESQRRSPDDLLQMSITAPDGRQVPLKTLASLTPQLAPTVIEHDGLQRTISVLAYYRKGGPPSMDLAMAIITRASSQINFPPGYSLQMRGDMTQMMDSFARLLHGLELSVLLIFLVLVAQFRGLFAPFQMILSIPLELSGVFCGLWLAHQAFSSVSIMAVIVLTGMDITTAILLIDQIMRRRAEGKLPREEAVALACQDRLRPILMTSLITIITMLPVALAPRTGMDAYQPLGTVIVSGLLVGTLLSLLVIPVMHVAVDDAGHWLQRQWQRQRVGKAASMLLGLAMVGTLLRPALADVPTLPAVSSRLSLADAVAVAMANNLTLKEALADRDTASAEARSAGAEAKPSLSTTTYGSAGDSSNIFTTSPGVAPQNLFNIPAHGFADQNLMLMIPLSTGGRITGRIQAGRSQAAAATASLDAMRRVVTETVAEAYTTALLRQNLVDVAQSRLDAEDEQVRVTQEKVKTGRSAPVDLLREQAEQADARQALLLSRNDVALALVALKFSLGVSQDSPITLSDTLDDLADRSLALPDSLGGVQKLALAHRPELAAAARNVEAAQAAVKEAQGAYAPQVYGVAMGDLMTSSPGQGHAGYSVGITASLPLADGGQRRADVDAARARLTRAEAEAQAAQQSVVQEAVTAWLNLQTAVEATRDATAGVTAAAEAYRLADLRYNAGKSVAAERLDALSALTRAQGSSAQAAADFVIARIKLQQAIGGMTSQ
jgi:HAE1 family hydrophobic/amphiphilic exporter-1